MRNHRYSRIFVILLTVGIACVTPVTASQAYVSISGISSVSAINRTDSSQSKSFPTANGSVAVAISPDGNTLYVANETGYSVSVVDAATGEISASIPLTSEPYGLAVSPDGSRLYVLTQVPCSLAVVGIDTASNNVVFNVGIPGDENGCSATPHLPAPVISADSQTIYIATTPLILFDVPSQSVRATIQTQGGYDGVAGFAVTPDQKFALVTGNLVADGRGELALIDLTSRTTVQTVKLGGGDTFGPAVIAPDGSLAYVIRNQREQGHVEVEEFNFATETITRSLIARAGTGTALALTPDGSELELGDTSNSTVIKVDTSSGAINGTSAVLGELYYNGLAANGQWIYAANFASSLAEVVNGSPGGIPVGNASNSIQVSRNGKIAAVLGDKNLVVFNPLNRQALGVVPINGSAIDFAMGPSGQVAFVLIAAFDSGPLIDVVDLQSFRITKRLRYPNSYPQHMAISPDGTTLYVTDEACSPICVEDLVGISTADLQVTQELELSTAGYFPGAIVIAADGATAYVGTVLPPSRSAISVVDLNAGKVTATIGLNGEFSPSALALAPGGHVLYAVPGIWVVDVQKQTLVTTLSDNMITAPFRVAVSPDSTFAYVTNTGGNSILVIAAPPGGIPYVSGTLDVSGPSYGVAFTQ